MPRKKKIAESKAESRAVIAAIPDASWVKPTELEAEIEAAEVEEAKLPPLPPVQPSHLPPCALEDVPIGSKVVVVRDEGKKVPILSTPQGRITLLPTDVAFTLPEGAKIRKLGEAMYAGDQLNPVVSRPTLTVSTARDCVARFTAHFHG